MKGMKIILILLFLVVGNMNLYAIVGGIRILYNNTIITFQKENSILSVDLGSIMHRFDNPVTFQYINSLQNNSYYYFMFFGIQPFGIPPYGTGPCGACIMEAAIIIKLSEDFTEYEISSQYLTGVGNELRTSNEVILDKFKLDGTIFHWFIEGRELLEKKLERRMIISVDASQLENGFIINEFPTYDLLVYHWLTNTRGTVINEENNNGSFILFR